MALKNLFDMVKADRYTQDGREEIIKAQEAETEDKVYQIGEISQATGLQKTANGWVKPKSGKQPGAKKPDNTREKLRKFREASSKKQELPSDLQKQAQEYVAWEKPENIQRYIKNLRTPFSRERDSFENPDKLAEALEVELKKKTEGNKPAAEKPERFDYRSSLEKNPRDAFSFKGTVTHSIPTNQYHYDELQNLASFMREEKATYQNALKSRAQALVDGHKSNGDWEPKKEQALMDIAKAVGFDDELHTFIAEENRGYDLGYSEDAAPSLSEIVDRVYNIGEISEKTGLMKTANGWVKPPRNKEIQNAGKHAESVKAAQKAKKEEARKQQRAEGEANARAFQEKVEKGEIKPAEETKTGVPVQGSDWLSLPSGTRMTFEGAKEKMAKNNERIETIKKMMEGKSRADNFRLGSELKSLQNENEYIAEKLPPEKTESPSAPKFETEQENAKYEEGKKGWETVSKERLPDIKKKVEQKIDYYKKYDPYAMLGKRTGLNAAQKKAVEQNMAQAKENLAFFTGQLEGINEQLGATDAAPRVLTGDTRIRVRKA